MAEKRAAFAALFLIRKCVQRHLVRQKLTEAGPAEGFDPQKALQGVDRIIARSAKADSRSDMAHSMTMRAIISTGSAVRLMRPWK